MASTSTNLGLHLWGATGDYFSHTELAANFQAIDDFATSVKQTQILANIPTSGNFSGRLVTLSAADQGIPAWTLIRYDGLAWRVVGPIELQASVPVSNTYAGRVVLLSAASAPYAAWTMLVHTGTQWSAVGNFSIYKGGTLIATRNNLNFIEGTNITLGITEDVGNSRVNVTVNADGAITKPGSPSADQILAYTSSVWTAQKLVDANVASGAGITYSKLNLNASVIDADISASAAIAPTKLALGSADTVLASNGSANSFSTTTGANARVAVRKNGSSIGTRRGINFIEGSGISFTIADNPGSERVDITVARATPIYVSRIYRNSNQSIADSTSAAISFTTATYDPSSFWSSGSHLTFPASSDGYYSITAHVDFAFNSGGYRQISIVKNGTTTIATTSIDASSNNDTILSLTTEYSFVATDYIQLFVYQNSGGALDVVRAADYSPVLSLHRIGS